MLAAVYDIYTIKIVNYGHKMVCTFNSTENSAKFCDSMHPSSIPRKYARKKIFFSFFLRLIRPTLYNDKIVFNCVRNSIKVWLLPIVKCINRKILVFLAYVKSYD